MLDILITMMFLWLFAKAVKLAFKTAWGAAKIAACVLIAFAGILMILGLIFTGAVLLLAAAVVIGIALLILRACK